MPLQSARDWLKTSCPRKFEANVATGISVLSTHPSHVISNYRGLPHCRKCGCRGPSKLVNLAQECVPAVHGSYGYYNLRALSEGRLLYQMKAWPEEFHEKIDLSVDGGGADAVRNTDLATPQDAATVRKAGQACTVRNAGAIAKPSDPAAKGKASKQIPFPNFAYGQIIKKEDKANVGSPSAATMQDVASSSAASVEPVSVRRPYNMPFYPALHAMQQIAGSDQQNVSQSTHVIHAPTPKVAKKVTFSGGPSDIQDAKWYDDVSPTLPPVPKSSTGGTQGSSSSTFASRAVVQKPVRVLARMSSAEAVQSFLSSENRTTTSEPNDSIDSIIDANGAEVVLQNPIENGTDANSE